MVEIWLVVIAFASAIGGASVMAMFNSHSYEKGWDDAINHLRGLHDE